MLVASEHSDIMRVSSIVSATLLIGACLAQQTAPDPSATFKSSAREVLLEVVVRDARGHLVTKIDPSQVAVYEDGVRQEMRSFRLVQGREVHEEDAKQAKQTASTPAVPRSVPRPRFNPLRTVNVVCLILNDLGPDTRAFAFDAARKFVNKELRPDTFIGVFSLDASGLKPVFPFSNNREHLLKAVGLAAVNQLPTLTQSSAAMLNGLSMSTIGVPVDATGGPGVNSGSDGFADGSSPQDPLGTRGDMGLAVNAGLREIDALKRLVNQLSPLPFQKTVLLMSTGLTRPPDQIEYWNSLISAANKGGVTFYGLDVYGLGVCQDSSNGDCATASTATAASTALVHKTAQLSAGQSNAGLSGGPTVGPPPGGQGGGGKPSAAAQMMESMHQTDYLRFGVLSANKQEALRELSESTGGFIIANTNNTEKLLARVMEDVDTHYELAYRPASVTSDGHFRKIEVKLARADLRVQTRSGYFAVPETSEGPLTPEEMTGLRALDTSPRPHAFDFGSKAFRFRSEKGTTQYAIAFEVPISNLTATAEAAAKKHRIHASLLALVKNAQGEIVERVSKDVPSDVPDQYLPSLRLDTMTYEHAINLGPGHYSVETAVVDQQGNRASTSILQIENREQPGPGLSDIVLVHRVQDLTRPPDPSDPFEIPGKRVQPFVSNTLPVGAKPSLYFVVYPQKETAEIPSMRAQFLQDGRVLATQNSALPKPDSSGAVSIAIQTIAKPGDYEVRITIEQGRSSVQRSLKYTIAAN
jgi:VWFA-related protein